MTSTNSTNSDQSRGVVCCVTPYDPATSTPSAGEVFLRRWLERLARHFDVVVLSSKRADRPSDVLLPEKVRVVHVEGPDYDARGLLMKVADGMGPPHWVRKKLLSAPYREILAHADLIEVQWPSMAGLLAELRREFPAIPITYLTHDLRVEALISLGTTRPFNRINAAALAKAIRVAPQEYRALRVPDLVLCFRDDERRILERLRRGRGEVHQLEPALQSAPMDIQSSATISHDDRLRLGFVADFQRTENIRSALWFREQIWTKILRAHPNVDLVLVGRYGAEVEKMFVNDPRVSLTGWVATLDAAYGSFDIAIAPLIVRGGIKFKVAEALAYGLPIIGSPISAAGYPADLRAVVDIAVTPGDWIEAVGRYIRGDTWRLGGAERQARFKASLDFATNVDRAAKKYARLIAGEAKRPLS